MIQQVFIIIYFKLKFDAVQLEVRHVHVWPVSAVSQNAVRSKQKPQETNAALCKTVFLLYDTQFFQYSLSLFFLVEGLFKLKAPGGYLLHVSLLPVFMHCYSMLIYELVGRRGFQCQEYELVQCTEHFLQCWRHRRVLSKINAAICCLGTWKLNITSK